MLLSQKSQKEFYIMFGKIAPHRGRKNCVWKLQSSTGVSHTSMCKTCGKPHPNKSNTLGIQTDSFRNEGLGRATSKEALPPELLSYDEGNVKQVLEKEVINVSHGTMNNYRKAAVMNSFYLACNVYSNVFPSSSSLLLFYLSITVVG